jgi:hypothetical protein
MTAAHRAGKKALLQLFKKLENPDFPASFFRN